MRAARPSMSFVMLLAVTAAMLVPASATGARAGELATLEMPAGQAAPAAQAQAVAPEGAAERRPIELPDILDWKGISAPTLAKDGSWFAYTLRPTEGDSEVVVRSTSGDTEYRFPAGEMAGFGGTTLAFSGDSAWFAFARRPTAEAAKAALKARKPLHDTAVLVNLADGATREVEGARGLEFSGSGWYAVHKAAPESRESDSEKWSGTDLILRRLANNAALTLGNVGSFAFNEAGSHLAVALDTRGRTGNGVVLHELGSGRVMPLDSDEAGYTRLSWSDEGDAFTVLKGRKDDGFEEELYSVLAFADLEATEPRRVVYDPAADESFPAGMTVSPDHDAEWSDDRGTLVFRIHEVDPVEGGEDGEAGGEGEAERGGSRNADDEVDTADLVIWHWKDLRLQSQQQVQERRDRSFGYLAAFHVEGSRFVRLADESARDADAAAGQRWAVARDDDAYERLGNLDGRRYTDVYVADMQTGERRRVLEMMRWVYDTSPSGDHLLYYDEGNFHALALATGESRNLTGDLPVAFWDDEDDHNVVMPPRSQFGLGWSADGESLVLSDGWDLWRVAVDGSEAVNLTVDGRERAIRYRAPFRLDPEAEGLDLLAPLYLRAYGEWTKKGGVARLSPGRTGAEMLAWDDAQFNGLIKAEEADVWVYTRETNEVFPDWRVTDANLVPGVRLTDANPQQAEHLWSAGVRLIDYTSAKGDKLQGALFLPAGYEEGRSYPTLVYIYERLSQNANRYVAPTANGFNASVYTSRGYAVLMPDIVYQIDDPGMSAVWCVLPALDSAIATGVVDAEAVGLHGHSWGGYQTSFLVTQTDRFAAAIAGAPLTNMISMYSLVYKNSGGGNGAIFESSQGRFTGGPWDVPEAYVRNSPVFHATNVTTPLVILHNDQDGAVDFTQGVEYYNTLRRLDKNVVMLEYVGENHGLRDPANRKDYTVRVGEFFDHYLRDLGMPAWLRDGVPHLELQDHLKERARSLARAVQEALEKKTAKGEVEPPAGDAAVERSARSGGRERQ